MSTHDYAVYRPRAAREAVRAAPAGSESGVPSRRVPRAPPGSSAAPPTEEYNRGPSRDCDARRAGGGGGSRRAVPCGITKPDNRIVLRITYAIPETTARWSVAPPAGDWREEASYVDLVAPRARRDDYRTFVTARPLDGALRDLAGDPSLLRPPGAWTPESLGTRDAFGDSGEIDAWTVARLYGGTAVRVAAIRGRTAWKWSKTGHW